MRRVVLLPLIFIGCGPPREAVREPAALISPIPAATAPAAPSASEVDFDSRVRPLLQARCSPCHFPGGIMHSRLPFDQADTVRCLGTKLFTRLQAGEDQALILRFLSTPAPPAP